MPLPRNYLTARAALQKTIPRNRKPLIKNEGGITRVNIYDEIGPWGVTASDFIDQFSAADVTGDVHVHINSPGGDVYDGLAIFNELKRSPANVVVHIDGLAASAASFIAQAGDEIVVARNARMMIHDASTMVFGNEADLIETAAWLGEESDNIADIYAQRAGGEASDWRSTMRAETWYSGAQAVAAGLADKVAGEDEGDAETSVAASLFRNVPGGPAQPVNEVKSASTEIDFGQIAASLRGAFK